MYWHWQSIKNKFNKALANQFVVIRYLQLKLLMSCHRGKLTPDECKIFFPIKVDTKKIFFVMRIPEWQTLAQMIYLKNNGKLVNVIHQRNCLLSSCIKKSLISSLSPYIYIRWKSYKNKFFKFLTHRKKILDVNSDEKVAEVNYADAQSFKRRKL